MSLCFVTRITFFYALIVPCIYAAQGEHTDEAIRKYVLDHLAKNRSTEIQAIIKADTFPFIGAGSGLPTESEIRLAKLLLETKIPISQACSEKMKSMQAKIQIDLVTEGHADPNSALEQELLVANVAKAQREYLLLEGKTAHFPHLFGGNYTAQASLIDWGKNVQGWECPTSSMYTDLMYGIPEIMKELKVGQGKSKAWDTLSLLFAKNPPEMLLQLFSSLPSDVGDTAFSKAMLGYTNLRIKDKTINPFVVEPYRAQMNKLFVSTDVVDIIMFVQLSFHELYAQNLPDFMKLEMPELPLDSLAELSSTLPDPLKDIYSIFDAKALDQGYRNRCAAKAAIDKICEVVEVSDEAVHLSIILGRAHFAGIQTQLVNNLPNVVLSPVDNWARYLDMSVEDRIKEANRIRKLLAN